MARTGRKIAISAIVAAVAGYITGILTAPKSGRQTREDIADKAVDVKEGAEEQLQNVQDDLKKLINDTKGKTVALKAQAREEYNEAVAAAKDAQNKAGAVLKSFKIGEAQDPDLNKAIKQAQLAKKNLMKYLKS